MAASDALCSILFEDQHLIVVDKPPGMLSQGGDADVGGCNNIVDWLRRRLGRPYVGLVHRLDRNTSGVMVVAKRTKAARRLTEALRDGALKRVYLAIVRGHVPGPCTWRHFLEKDASTNKVRICKSGEMKAGAKEAVLRVAPLKYSSTQSLATLAEFELETGRSHQIRAQAAHERHPVVGDRKYGCHTGVKTESYGIQRPALHSLRILFPHPMSGEVMRFEAGIPADIEKVSRILFDARCVI